MTPIGLALVSWFQRWCGAARLEVGIVWEDRSAEFFRILETHKPVLCGNEFHNVLALELFDGISLHWPWLNCKGRSGDHVLAKWRGRKVVLAGGDRVSTFGGS